MEDRKPLLLIVDDQITVIRVLANILQPDYAVCVATSGENARSVARHQLPDLILLDMIMPGMTGIEVCEHLKAEPVTMNIPVIFVTSMNDRDNEEVGFKVGAVDYIGKPASPAITS